MKPSICGRLDAFLLSCCEETLSSQVPHRAVSGTVPVMYARCITGTVCTLHTNAALPNKRASTSYILFLLKYSVHTGRNYPNQVELIFEVLGYSSAEDLGFPISQEAVAFLDKRCRYRKQDMTQVMPGASAMAISFVSDLIR